MITGDLRSRVDRLWDAFWSGGISNPLEVIEQITYLLFIKRLDELHTAQEAKANRLKKVIENPIFSEEQQELRWSRFKNEAPPEMYKIVSEKVFPFIKELNSDREDSTYQHHMKDARFTIPNAGLLAKVVDMIDKIPMEDRDTKGDLYEYMLSKIATAGQNGQFRTPRHIIRLMVELVKPTPNDIVCDPACGTAGFLVATGEYLRENYKEIFTDDKLRNHFHEKLFNGFDFDSTMLRIGSMNMLLHGVENPNIRYKDSLAEEHAGDEERYTLVLANPPFAGSLDYENTAKDLQRVVKTKKTELLFLALFLRLLKPGGRAAVIVPEGVLFGSSNAHKTLRRIHDLAWNPSNIEQRTGRIDRLGCKAEGRDCIVVYLPYLAGTADERQYRVMSDRERWFRVVMGQDEVAKLIKPESDDAIPLPETISADLSFNLGLVSSY